MEKTANKKALIIGGVAAAVVVIVAVVLVFVLMPKTKTLSCSKEDGSEELGLSAKETFNIKYTGDKAEKEMTLVNHVEAKSDLITNNWDEFVSSSTEEFTGADEVEGVTIETKSDDKAHTIDVTIKIDSEKISDENLDGFEFDKEIKDAKSTKIDDMKSKIEADHEGFKCEIK